MNFWFDWAATALPNKTEQQRALSESLNFIGNPSSIHSDGKNAREYLEEQRKLCANSLQLPSKELFFTSGASESNLIILYSLLQRQPNSALLTSHIEHPSVRNTAIILERLGVPVYELPVLSNGQIDKKALEKLIQENKDIRMLSLMGVNNEIGSLYPIQELTELVRQAAGPRAKSIHIHLDGVQMMGKIPFNIYESDADSLSLSAHKLGGPRGVGLLWTKKELQSLYLAGGQEGGLRGGTENLFGARALALALDRCLHADNLALQYDKTTKNTAYFLKNLPKAVSVFPPSRQPIDPLFSPYIVQLIHKHYPSQALVRLLDARGISVSSSSACSSSKNKKPVLEKLGLAEQDSRNAFRVSFGPSTTIEAITTLIHALGEI